MVFKTFRDKEKKLPNELQTVRLTISNCRQGIKLNELFPRELFDQSGYRIGPEAANILDQRTQQNMNWSDRLKEKIHLPVPILNTPLSFAYYQEQWKNKINIYSEENREYMFSRVT